MAYLGSRSIPLEAKEMQFLRSSQEAVRKISTDIDCRAAPLQQLSFKLAIKLCNTLFVCQTSLMH